MDAVTLTLEQALALCEAAALRCGANQAMAAAIAAAAVRAEAEGQSVVGLSHFLDYLNSLKAGRIDGLAEPVISQPAPAIILSDAHRGVAHTGFDRAFADLSGAARSFGLALFCQRNAYTCGALGHFAVRLAEVGLAGLAATNGPAILAGSGGKRPVFSTNPLAFAAPVAGHPPLLIDQSSSEAAFVTIRQAARDGRAIPEGWAVDAEGRPTVDPRKAMAGALLAFGGARGANIALMVEMLAAGVTGANWSLDSKSSDSPGSGLFVLAIDPRVIDPHFSRRVAAQLDRLSSRYGLHIPGLARVNARVKAESEGISVPAAVYWKISET